MVAVGAQGRGLHGQAKLGIHVRQMLVLSLHCPFYLAQDPSPWVSAAHV